ncbi:MAG: sorting protein [Pseudomonadota bacterium]|nr:sorting protein [Pseudomonadota bacterium]
MPPNDFPQTPFHSLDREHAMPRHNDKPCPSSRTPVGLHARLHAGLVRLFSLLLFLPGLALAAPFAYIANWTGNSVSVIDDATATVTMTVPVGINPYGVGVNSAGTRVYVSNTGGNSVSVIDGTTNTVIDTVPVGNGPRGVAVNSPGTRAYVANAGGNSVSVIDGASNTVITTVAVGNNPLSLAVNPAGTRVYVSNFNDNTVSVIDAATNTVIRTVPVGSGPHGLAFNPAGTRAYVTNYLGNTVSVIDTLTHTMIAMVLNPGSPSSLSVNPAGTRVYVSNNAGWNVSVIDAATYALIATVPVGNAPGGVAVNPAGTRAYVTTTAGNTVFVINTATLATSTVTVGSAPFSPGQFIAWAVPDTTPDAFSFTAQTDAALSTLATSNPISVAGLNTADVAIGIAGGSYSINGGAYTSAAGVVRNGDTVSVRQISSASFGTLTTATLSIGGFSGAFDVTTLAADTTPDAFGFIAQTGVALNTLTTSNSITVAGLNTAAPIGIVGGSYSINGGAYTSAPGTVINADSVTVQQTSSASFGVLTTATLSIGGVSGAFDVTTLPPVVSYTAPAATGDITASFTGGGAGCGYSVSQYIPLSGHSASPPAAAPAGFLFPHGLFDFTLRGCTPGSTITLTITYPQTLPAGTVYWKYGPTPTDGSYHWYQLPATISGNTATFSITDGGLGDDDLTANGTIVDQGGPGVPAEAAAIPTLSEWALLLLAGLMGLFGVGAMRRRGA